MKKELHPAYSVPVPYAVLDGKSGLTVGLAQYGDIVPSTRSEDSIQRNIKVDGAIHMGTDIHEGGKYRFGDGTQTAPAIAFKGSPKSGLRRSSANVIKIPINGTDVATIDSTGIHPIAVGAITPVTSDRLIGRDTAGSGAAEEITVGGNLEFTGSGGIQRGALSGDVSASAGSGTTAIGADKVLNTMLDNMAQSTIKGRAVGAGTGDPTDLTATQATAILDNLVGDSGAGGTKGLAPAPAAGDAAAGKFLKADGTWTAPATGGSHALMDGATVTDSVAVTVAKGSIPVGNSTPKWDDLVVGSDGLPIVADSAQTLGVKYGVLGIAGGGTGQATQTSAFDALAPTTTTGDIIYHNGTDNVRLAVGSTRDLMTVSAGAPAWSAPILKGHIFGLTMSNAADTVNDITVAAGEAGEESGGLLMILSSALTKQLDATWAVGDAAGGLNTGTVTANTWYEVHLIKRTDTGVVDVMFTTTANRATLPTNYTLQRRIGWIRRNASTILQFTQKGDHITLTTPINDISATATASATSRTMTVPPAALGRFRAAVLSNVSINAANGIVISEIAEADTAPTTTNGHLTIGGGDFAIMDACHFELRVDSSSQIRDRAITATGSAAYDIETFGWVDHRRRLENA